MKAEKRILAAPFIAPETEEYWNSTRDGKLMIRYCKSCDAYHHYPRTICPRCGSDDTEYRESTGTGVIYTYSVMRRAPVPYAIAYVTLDGTDISMMTNIVDCDLDSLSIGQKVKLDFADSEGDGPPVPVFTPV
ncbi:MAG: Zn-ribbon domain-containing OB-fold protein [Sneathiellales bacterium]|nr:Zn-ribbon domain-containing OB-fold protein [Sneathiellales bacterium]